MLTSLPASIVNHKPPDLGILIRFSLTPSRSSTVFGNLDPGLQLLPHAADLLGNRMEGIVFVNYRRDDDPGFSGRLYDWLERDLGAQQIFMDIDNIEPGLDFERVLDAKVAQCDVLLAVIGPRWLTVVDEEGKDVWRTTRILCASKFRQR